MDIKSEIINFLYCFDDNYNLQGFTSIISLLDVVQNNVNINIIHKETIDIYNFPKAIKDHPRLNSLNIYKFNDLGYSFPKIENTHVTEATYYRLFIHNYLKDISGILVYLDADTILVKDPTELILNYSKQLKTSGYIFAARTEIEKASVENYRDFYIYDKALPFERLGIDELYFNAGVLLINYDLWIQKNIGNKLIEKMDSLGDNIVAWDQDVINSFTNGKYIELEKWINFYNVDVNEKSLDSEVVLIHYLGSKKPWKVSGVFTHASKYYHHNFRKISNTDYHITHQWKLYSLRELLINIVNLNIIKIDKPLRFILNFAKSIID